MSLIPITYQMTYQAAQQAPSSGIPFAIYFILYIGCVTIFIESIEVMREQKTILWCMFIPPLLLFLMAIWIVKQWIKSRKRRVKLERIEKKRVARKLKKRLLLDAKLTAELRRVGVI